MQELHLPPGTIPEQWLCKYPTMQPLTERPSHPIPAGLRALALVAAVACWFMASAKSLDTTVASGRACAMQRAGCPGPDARSSTEKPVPEGEGAKVLTMSVMIGQGPVG